MKHTEEWAKKVKVSGFDLKKNMYAYRDLFIVCMGMHTNTC